MVSGGRVNLAVSICFVRANCLLLVLADDLAFRERRWRPWAHLAALRCELLAARQERPTQISFARCVSQSDSDDVCVSVRESRTGVDGWLLTGLIFCNMAVLLSRPWDVCNNIEQVRAVLLCNGR